MNLDSSVEKAPGRWEPLAPENGLKDWEDIVRFRTENNSPPMLLSPEQLRTTYSKGPGAGGLVFRLGDRVAGYLLFKIERRDNTELYIKILEVGKSSRSPGMASKLIQVLRRTAEEYGATHVSWGPPSRDMTKISERIADEKNTAIGYYRIPVEQLDISNLAGRI